MTQNIQLIMLSIAFILLMGFALYSQHELAMKLATSCTNGQAAREEILGQMLPDMQRKP